MIGVALIKIATIVADQDCDHCGFLRQLWLIATIVNIAIIVSHQACIPVINWYLLCHWFVAEFRGGWWFKKCHMACLTCGPWRTSADASFGGMGYAPYAHGKALKAAEMKLKLPWTDSFSLFTCHSFHRSSFHSTLFCSLQKLLTAIQNNFWQKAIEAFSPNLMINIDQAYVSEDQHIFFRIVPNDELRD